MSTYSAWFVTQKGHPSKVLQLKTGLPIPNQLKKGHVLVKIQAAALNPAGYKLMGAVPNLLAGRPHVAENDFTGIVVDPNGSEFTAGDKVFGSSLRIGTLTEYAVIPSESMVSVPPNISAVEAAGLGIVVATAYQGLVAKLKIESGQTVFINGGSSGVGLSAIQIAKSMGCKVVATASGRNKELLLSLGVDEFIDYTEAPLVEQLISKPPSPKFHAIYDAVGLTDPALYLNSASYLAPGGIYLTAGTLPSTRTEITGVLRQIVEGLLRPTWLGGVPRKYVPLFVNMGKKDLETVRDLVAEGAVKPIVDSVYSFDQDGVMKAYEKMMSKRAVGKVVVKVSNEE
ncbi:NAD(P)-binding protein [Mycena epipterygia]|nr:NAD(P)-binding protein [Mycena epipterygia]